MWGEIDWGEAFATFLAAVMMVAMLAWLSKVCAAEKDPPRTIDSATIMAAMRSPQWR
jgi:uncharacterized protein YfaQ (DUF2300 family)